MAAIVTSYGAMFVTETRAATASVSGPLLTETRSAPPVTPSGSAILLIGL